VDTSPERDQSIERLLRQSLQAPRHAGVTDSCLDAETLATWVDGGLSGAALEMAQSHVADCARCQSLVGAMARTNAAVSQPERAARRWLGWLVPLTAAAAAVALWVAVPQQKRIAVAPAPPVTDVQEQAAETNAPISGALDNPSQAPAALKKEPAAQTPTENFESQVAAPELRKDAAQVEGRLLERDAVSAPAAAAPPARRADEGTVTARSANAADLQGPRRAVAETCGASWDSLPTDITAQLTASAAPSISVCWAVGRGGVVMLTTDGRTWRRVAFPEITDLSSVRATDARTASITTADGRMFSTSDGGVTWDRP
jgi:hypothetical protein